MTRIIPIRGDGNCLFRSISYCMYRTQEKHREVRLRCIEWVAQEWTRYKDFIIGDSSYGSVKTANEYKNMMSRDGEYAGHVELHSASEIYTDYTFKVHTQRGGAKTIDYGHGGTVCHLLFSGFMDAGHYSVIEIL